MFVNCLRANSLSVSVKRNYEPLQHQNNSTKSTSENKVPTIPGLMKAALSGLTSLLVVRQGTSASQIVSPVVGGKN